MTYYLFFSFKFHFFQRNSRIAKIRELGLRSRLVQRWAARTPHCRKDIMVIDPLTIYETAAAFLLLLFGAIIGIALFVIERINYCKRFYDQRKIMSKKSKIQAIYPKIHNKK